uniref:Uncharacterized protein n=1 Tax=Tanacetum cinerariifolium TaxID=118510 RepID=A0A699KAA3_TANCI|nr:hypothetical protein [Tanacetum cinerariifolium]
MHVELKAPKTSLKDEKKDPKGKKPRARNAPRRKHTSSSTKHNPGSKIDANKSGSASKEPTGSKTGHSHKETKSSSALDSNPSQPSASTLVVAEMHKEDQQATGGPTSLEVTSKGGANPQLNSSMEESQQYCKKIEEEFNTSPDISSYEDILKEIKLEDLSRLVQDIRVNFMDLDSQKDDPIIVVDESEVEEESKENHATKHTNTEDTLAPQPSSPRFFTEGGDHVHLTEEQIKAQKRIKESTEAEAAKHEVKVRKEEPIDLLGPDVVSKYYKAKLQYEKYYYKMLNRRASSKITNSDVLTRKGPITLKVYREDGTSEVIPNFKASGLHLGE